MIAEQEAAEMNKGTMTNQLDVREWLDGLGDNDPDEADVDRAFKVVYGRKPTYDLDEGTQNRFSLICAALLSDDAHLEAEVSE